ncbi:hypothetical protein R80B4_00242 [Fibrobacteres bacterium R8-0-B4]
MTTVKSVNRIVGTAVAAAVAVLCLAGEAGAYTVTFNANNATSVFYEDFENGGESWDADNGSYNNGWSLSNPALSRGNAATINNGYTYDGHENTIVHLWRDISFGTFNSACTLSFYTTGAGLDGYSNLTVRYSTPDYTPVAGSTFSNGKILGTYGWMNCNGWAPQIIIVIPAETWSDKTVRLVFSWSSKNYPDALVPMCRPAVIDEIRISPGTVATTTTDETDEDGKLTSLPTPPARIDYAFNGWFTATSGGTEVTTNTVFSANATVYAQWTLIRTITFDANGGSVTPTSGKTGAGGKLESLPTPTRGDDVFIGWFTAATGGTQVTTSKIFYSNTTIYARWKINPTFIFEDFSTSAPTGWTYDGFSRVTSGGYDNTAALRADLGGDITIPNVAIGVDGKLSFYYTLKVISSGTEGSGYRPKVYISTADGSWKAMNVYTADSNGRGDYTADLSDYANSIVSVRINVLDGTNVYVYLDDINITSEGKYIIRFNANGGSVTPATDTSAGGTLSSLPAPTRDGYTFNGWFTAATGGTKITTNSVYNANTTIYAQWTVNTYTITFNANSGTVTPASGTTGIGGKLTSLPTPTRTDHIFNGWFTAATGGTQVTTNTVFSANTVIYAQWTVSERPTVTFNANGGSVSPTYSVIGADGKLASLPEPATRIGYAFDGWFTAAAGGTRVTTSTVFNGNTTIYARWTVSTYTVTFGAGENGSLTATVDGSSIASGAAVQYGKSVVFNAVPASNYNVGDWTFNDEIAAVGDSVYTLTSVSEDVKVAVSFIEKLSVLASGREIPQSNPSSSGVAVIAPVNRLSAEFAAGPSPVSKNSGYITFFSPKAVKSGTLYVFDESGGAVAKIPVKSGAGGKGIGVWNLRDKRGAAVSGGSYIAKGVLVGKDGNKEAVSFVFSVVR